MSDKKQVQSGGVGFFGLLTILFVGLKLSDQIDWSWWWVLSPLWIPFSIGLAFGCFCLVMAALAGQLK